VSWREKSSAGTAIFQRRVEKECAIQKQGKKTDDEECADVLSGYAIGKIVGRERDKRSGIPSS